MMDNLFFYLSKTIGLLLNFDFSIVLIGVLGLLIYYKYKKFGLFLISVNLLSLLTLTFLPLGNLLLSPLEHRFNQPKNLPDNIAGIIYLGGSEDISASTHWKVNSFNGAAERAMIIPKLAHYYPDAPILITGGFGTLKQKKLTGAEIMKNWLEDIDLLNPILIEKNSRNTWENALNSKKYIVSELPWILVTSAFHMPRSVGIFRRLEWNIVPYPTDFRSYALVTNTSLSKNLRDLSIATREWAGLLAYYFTNRTSELFPQELKRQ